MKQLAELKRQREEAKKNPPVAAKPVEEVKEEPKVDPNKFLVE